VVQLLLQRTDWNLQILITSRRYGRTFWFSERSNKTASIHLHLHHRGSGMNSLSMEIKQTQTQKDRLITWLSSLHPGCNSTRYYPKSNQLKQLHIVSSPLKMFQLCLRQSLQSYQASREMDSTLMESSHLPQRNLQACMLLCSLIWKFITQLFRTRIILTPGLWLSLKSPGIPPLLLLDRTRQCLQHHSKRF